MSNRSEEEVSQIIDRCLQQVLSGSSSIETVLFKYPELADILRLELETAMHLARVSPKFGPSPGFVSKSKARLIERIEQEAAYEKAALRRSRPVQASKPARTWGFGQAWLWRFAGVAAIIMFLFMSFTGTVYAARETVPGETLYGFKRWTEETTYSLTFDIERQAQLRLAFSTRRLDEAALLLARGQDDLFVQVVADYEREVEKAVTVLEKIKQSKSESTEILAVYMYNEIDRHEDRLYALLEKAPAGKSDDALEHAVEVSKRSSEKVEILGKGRAPIPTPFPASTQKPSTGTETVKGNEQDKPGQQPAGGKDTSGAGKDNQNSGGEPGEEKPAKDTPANERGTKTPAPETDKQPGKPKTDSVMPDVDEPEPNEQENLPPGKKNTDKP